MAADEKRMRWDTQTRNDGAARRIDTRSSDALQRSAVTCRLPVRNVTTPDTRLRRTAKRVWGGESDAEMPNNSLEIGFTSYRARTYWRRCGPIRKNIIGHWMASGIAAAREQFFGGTLFGIARGPFALLDEPAREHGAGIFFEPLIQQRANLLAEIGGMAEARKFVALERIARSREKKLPRRLGLLAEHGASWELGNG